MISPQQVEILSLSTGMIIKITKNNKNNKLKFYSEAGDE